MATSLVGAAIAILVAWVVISIPLYFAAKIISGRHATFLKALLASLIAPFFVFVVFTIFFVLFSVLTPFISIPIALIFSILALSYIYGVIFNTSLAGGFAIAILAFVLSFIIFAVLGAFISIVPALFPFFGNMPGKRFGLMLLGI